MIQIRRRFQPIAPATRSVVMLLIATLALSGCGTVVKRLNGAVTPVVRVAADEYSFDVKQTTPVPEGPVTISLTNDGAEDHQLNLLRLGAGQTLDSVKQAFASQDIEKFLGSGTFAGGANTIKPGEAQDVTQRLEAGTYLLLCFIGTGDDPTPHLIKGMVGELTVVEQEGHNPAEPKTEASISLKEYGFEIPAKFDGQGTYRVDNFGKEAHELVIGRLKEGKTIADVRAMFESEDESGEVPFEPAGGTGAAGPGRPVWIPLKLTAGNYVAVCFVPNAQTNAPHVAMGMLQDFTVE